MNRALLIPVKNLDQAKTRLAAVLSQAARTELAEIMLDGVLRASSGLDPGYRRVVVTSYPRAKEMAGDYGFEVISEENQVSESASVDWASEILAGQGVEGCLRLPLDLPLVTRAALEAVLEAIPGADVVLVPSHEGTGTNALYRAPPSAFPSRFGPDSCQLHQALAREQNLKLRVLESSVLALDVDGAEDLELLASRGVQCPAMEYLAGRGLAAWDGTVYTLKLNTGS